MLLENIGKYSPKLAKCMQYILTKTGKSFIYFNVVQTYGVNFICDVLKANGLLYYDEAVQSASICFNCRKSAGEHQRTQDHEFVAFRFFKITGEEG